MTARDELLRRVGLLEKAIRAAAPVGSMLVGTDDANDLRDLAQAVRELEAERDEYRNVNESVRVCSDVDHQRMLIDIGECVVCAAEESAHEAGVLRERCQRLETALREILERGCGGGVLERIEHPSCGRDDCPTCIARAALGDTA